MESTLENLEKLRLGSIIAEDILVNTKIPIIRKNTKVTREHIQVLLAFNITKVPIAVDNLFNRSEKELSKLNDEKENNVNNKIQSEVKSTFRELYNNAVNKYLKEFQSWESGAKVDVVRLRNIIMPLVEQAMVEKQTLLHLNDYSSIEKYIAHHSIAVGIITGTIARKLGYSKGEVIQIATAGLMADMGMSKVDYKIREKKSNLTEADFSVIKKHTIHSFQMIKDSPLLKPEMKLAIYQHHERLDGSGYPKGDKMGNISTFSQILAVADVYHAMTSERIYRAKSSPFKVLEMIKEEEFGKYSIEVVNALISLIGVVSISTRVLLSNGETGEIVFLHRDSPMRPMVRLIETGQILDLTKKRTIYIETVIE